MLISSWVGLICALLLPSEALAATPAECRASAALLELTLTDRNTVQSLCETKGIDETVTATFLDKLEVAPKWQMALFMRLARESWSNEAPKNPGAAAPLVKLKENLSTAVAALTKHPTQKKVPCSKAVQAFKEDATDRARGKFVQSPLRAETLEGCKSPELDEEQNVFVVIAGHAGDEVTVAFGIPHQAWHSMVVTQSVDVSGFRYFFAQVPRGSRTVIRHASSGDLQPARVDDQVLNGNHVSAPMADENAKYCMQFEGIMEGGGTVFLDGDPVPLSPRTPRNNDESKRKGKDENTNYFAARRFVRRDHHTLVVLNAAGQLRAEARIPPDDLKENDCYVRRFDLRTSKESTLLVSTESSCTQKGVVQPRIYYYAKSYIERSLQKGESFRDLEPWAAAISAITRVSTTVDSPGGRPRGGERARQDTRGAVRELAGELLRKGFNRAYIGHLSCSESTKSPTFTFVVHLLDLDAALDTESDELGGIDDNSQVLKTQHETVLDINDLSDLILAPLARLLNLPYGRLVTEQQKRRTFDYPTQPFEIWSPNKIPYRLRVYRLAADNAETRCASITRRRQLINTDRTDLTRMQGKLVQEVLYEHSLERGSNQPQRRRFTLKVDETGLYLVELELLTRFGMGLSVTRDCVAVDGDETVPRFALQVGMNPGVHELTSAIGGGGTHSHVMITAATPRMHGPPLMTWGLALGAGYAALSRYAGTPPSWNDLENSPDFEDDGTLQITWKRRSVLLALLPDFEYRFFCPFDAIFKTLNGCSDVSNRLKVIARAGPVIDIGTITTGEVPPELEDFRDGEAPDSHLFDGDVSALVQAGIGVTISEKIDFTLGGQLWFLGLDDVVGAQPENIRYDMLFAPGFFAELGYRP